MDISLRPCGCNLGEVNDELQYRDNPWLDILTLNFAVRPLVWQPNAVEKLTFSHYNLGFFKFWHLIYSDYSLMFQFPLCLFSSDWPEKPSWCPAQSDACKDFFKKSVVTNKGQLSHRWKSLRLIMTSFLPPPTPLLSPPHCLPDLWSAKPVWAVGISAWRPVTWSFPLRTYLMWDAAQWLWDVMCIYFFLNPTALSGCLSCLLSAGATSVGWKKGIPLAAAVPQGVHHLCRLGGEEPSSCKWIFVGKPKHVGLFQVVDLIFILFCPPDAGNWVRETVAM